MMGALVFQPDFLRCKPFRKRQPCFNGQNGLASDSPFEHQIYGPDRQQCAQSASQFFRLISGNGCIFSFSDFSNQSMHP
jgi:hypothetical protein